MVPTGFATLPAEFHRGDPVTNAIRLARPEGLSVVGLVVNPVLMVLNPVLMIWDQERPIFNPIWKQVLHVLGLYRKLVQIRMKNTNTNI